MKSVIALQCYTIRDFMKTRKDVESSLKKLRAIGVDAIETGSVQGLEDSEYSKILKGEGVAVATYSPAGKDIAEAPGKVIEAMDMLGTSHVMYGYPHIPFPKSALDYIGLAKTLEKAGAAFARNGKTLTYHNHSLEFEKFDGRLALEILFEETDPKLLQAELDTYWIHHGGGNPAEWCARMKGRLPRLHLKDYGIVNNADAGLRVKIFELGKGNLDWTGIVKAAKKAGCGCFAIEQDSCPGDPFDSIKSSFDYIVGIIRESDRER